MRKRIKTLWDAAGTGTLELALKHLDAGVDVDARGNAGVTPLWCASHMGHIEVMHLLLERGAAINAQTDGGGTPLMAACVNWIVPSVQLLLSRGANLELRDQHGRDAMGCLFSSNNIHQPTLLELVQMLFDRGADVNSSGGAPILQASRWGYADVVQLLLAHGADTTVKNYEDKTPLTLALEKGHTEVAEILRQAGATE